MKIIRTYLLLVLVSFVTLVSAQENVEFKNSTPKETVESHFTFLTGKNYNPKIAAYTLGETAFSSRKNEMLVIKLKEVLVKFNLNVDHVLDRKKGIVEKEKYMLFNNQPKLYLIKVKRKWVYSPETVNAIVAIYNREILHQDEEVKQKKEVVDEVLHLIQADTSNQIDFDLSTPYNTVLTHLLYTTDSLFDPVKASKTIRFVKRDSAQAESLAIKLSQIFLGSSKRLIDFSIISKDSNYIDSVSLTHIFYPNLTARKFYLEKVGDDWLYSVETSQLINSTHAEMFSDRADEVFKFSDKFKRWAGHEYKKVQFGIEKWQWLMLFYFIGILMLIWLASYFVVSRILKLIPFIKRYQKSINYLIKNITFIVFLKIATRYIPSVELGVEHIYVIHKFVGVLIIWFSTLLILNLLNLFVLYSTRGSAINSKKGVVVFVSLLLKIVIFVGCVLFIIAELEYSLINVLAGLSIGGFAIALGAQDTVKNFFGSIMIFADKPFAVGDFITDGKVMGTVEEVGIRTTKIRTAYNSVVTLPNSMLSDNSVDNWGKRDYRRYKSKITLEYDTSSELIQQFIDALKEEVLKEPSTRKDYYVITVNDFSLYGIEILINIFFIAPTWGEEMEARHQFVIRTLEIAKELGIEYAKPPR